MNTPTPGVHLLGRDEAEAWARQGWQTGCMRGGDTLREVLAMLGEALAFPSYYGKNMDAAWDCLSDLTEPTLLVWHDWHRFAVTHPGDWTALLGLFDDRCAQQPDFAVVLTR